MAAARVGAEVSAWQDLPHGRARLLATAQMAETAETAEEETLSSDLSPDLALGLEIELDEGWKIYWTYAGPVGQPTQIEGQNLPEGQSVDFFFPWPKRGTLQGFPSYGYEGSLIFPGILTGDTGASNTAGTRSNTETDSTETGNTETENTEMDSTGGGGLVARLSICSQTQCIPHRLTVDLPSYPVQKDVLALNKLRQAFANIPQPVAGTPTLGADRWAQSLALSNYGPHDLTDFLIAADGTAARQGFFLWSPYDGQDQEGEAQEGQDQVQEGQDQVQDQEVRGQEGQDRARGTLTSPYDIQDPEQRLGFIEAKADIYAIGPDGPVVFNLRRSEAYQALAQIIGAVTKGRMAEAPGGGDGQGLDPAPNQNLNQNLNQIRVGQGGRSAAATQPQAMGIWAAALFLFLGGLLLNVMPCVLPVLFVKMKALLAEDERSTKDMVADGGQRALRRSFGWTALGIIVTFVALGAVLSLAQVVTGGVFTLGVWLQFPLTTVFLASLVILFIANAFGWFEFVVPARVLTLGANRQGGSHQGQNHQGRNHQGPLGDMLAGMVAALLGGACAGVFMAVALTVAFAQPPALMTALLTLMGVGFALPYVLVALIPAAARLIPRPGPWMSWLKPLMGGGLFLTLGYLLFILERQLLPLGLMLVALMSLAGGAGLWVSARRRFALGRLMSLAILIVMVVLTPLFSRPPDPVETARDYGAEIDARVARGDRVFVDVTALWCATCQTNKLLVLDSADIQNLFAETDIYVFTIHADIMADNISAFMSAQRRNSLPLNILFSPKFPDGDILPSVLTKNAVREAVNRTL